ncbi:MAG: NusG domain II-containing protein [Oscillospiraceae bacterium]|nr:NusG domain II-containing protein [Oscillospiraceae bacterium]
MIKTRTWIIIIAAVAVCCGALALVLMNTRSNSHVAEVVQDGEVIREIDLSRVTREYSFTVTCDTGENVITVRPGGICVSDADCPDRVCVSQGWLTDRAAPIVCMPHRLIIRLKGSGDIDGAVR